MVSLGQGGTFRSGFWAGAASSVTAEAFGMGLRGLKINAETVPHGQLMPVYMLVGGVSGGVASSVSGGDFWKGFVQGAIVAGLNAALHMNGGGDGDGEKPATTKEVIYNANDAVGLGAEPSTLILKEYFESLKTNRTFGNMKGSYFKFPRTTGLMGSSAKILGGTGTGLGLLTTYFDFQSMQSGEISPFRFSFRTIGTGAGITVGSIFGAMPGVIVGGGFYMMETLYDGFQFGVQQFSIGLTPYITGGTGWLHR